MIALLMMLLACGSKPECSEEVGCGFGQTCVEGRCVSQSCATSAQCGMEQFCDNGTCVSGCAEDTDCYPGDACDTTTGTCVEASCRDSTLDCAYKQFCNNVTGECYDASGYYCHRCGDDSDCGGSGNMCLNWGQYGSYCGVTCQKESDCPSGYDCVSVTDGNGNVVSTQCVTYCWLYEENARSPALPGDAGARTLRPVPVGRSGEQVRLR